jgi:hypothetical protein
VEAQGGPAATAGPLIASIKEMSAVKPNGGAAQSKSPGLDRFNLKDLVINQNYLQAAGSTELVTTIKVAKPNRQEFFRINPDPEYQQTFGILENKIDREFYLVHEVMLPELAGEFFLATLYLGITKQGRLFIWPCRLPGEDGRQMDWHRTAFEAAEQAERRWVRVAADMQAGHNRIFVADADLGEPKWPGIPYEEILWIAFHGREGLISDLDHPIIKKLRGQI